MTFRQNNLSSYHAPWGGKTERIMAADWEEEISGQRRMVLLPH
jgi:hypothetical protein